MPGQKDTIKSLRAYTQGAEAPGFMASHFPWDGDFHTKKKVEFDERKIGRKPSKPLPDAGSVANQNNTSAYDTEGITPAILKEGEKMEVTDLGQSRNFGQNPYQDASIQAKGSQRVAHSMLALRKTLKVTIEQMTAQLMSEGAIDIKDENGNTIFEKSFGINPDLFFTAATPWGSDGTVLPTLRQQAELHQNLDGGRPVRVIWNSITLDMAMLDTEFKAAFGKSSDNTIQLFPLSTADTSDGKYYGRVSVGSWKFDIFLNDETYESLETGLPVKFVPDYYSLMVTNGFREMTYGQILTFPSAKRALANIPRVVIYKQMPLSVHSWFSTDGRVLEYDMGNRPLPLPRNKASLSRAKVYTP